MNDIERVSPENSASTLILGVQLKKLYFRDGQGEYKDGVSQQLIKYLKWW